MPGYFGDEPTCRRCDYPKRVHHLLNVEHEYRPSENGDAPDRGAGTPLAAEGIETKNTNPHQEGDDVTVHQTPDVDQPIGFALTNKAFEELKLRSAQSEKDVVKQVDDFEGRRGTEPRPYMTKVSPDLHLNSTLYRTHHVALPLAEYEGWWHHDEDNVHMAELRIGLCQRADQDYPLIEFERYVGEDGAAAGREARYVLRIDEGVRLAHTLLLLADVEHEAGGRAS